METNLYRGFPSLGGATIYRMSNVVSLLAKAHEKAKTINARQSLAYSPLGVAVSPPSEYQ